MRFVLVFFAGGAGALARYLVSGWVLRLSGPTFPAGTLIVNVIGSFLIGAIMHVALTTASMSPELRLALTTGFLGGFTTYSTFNYETIQLAQQGAWWLASLNIIITVVACLLAGLAGLGAGRLMAA